MRIVATSAPDALLERVGIDTRAGELRRQLLDRHVHSRRNRRVLGVDLGVGDVNFGFLGVANLFLLIAELIFLCVAN